MKKQFKRHLAIILSIAIVLTSLASAIAIGAAADSTQQSGTNILAGLTPIVYTTTNAGTLVDSMHELTCDGQANGLQGIDLPNNRGTARVDTWKPHLSRFTDGAVDQSSFLGVRFDSHNTDGIKLTYEIPASKLNSFSINVRTADVGKKTTGGIKVYAANSYADLEKESSVIATVSATTGSVNAAADSGDLINAKYVMFAFTTPLIHIYELELYGVEIGENILTGKTPIVYTTTNAGTLVDSMHELTCDGQANGLQGIDLPNNRGTARVDTWKPHLSRFTDGAVDQSSFLGVRFDSHNTDGIKLTYEIPASKLNAFSINVRTADVGKKTTGGIKVYAANSYADLEKESSVIATVPATTGSVAAVMNSSAPADAKYVMFAFTTPLIHIYELELYGEGETTSGGTSVDVLSAGQLPIAYAAYQNGNMTSAPAGNMYSPTTNNYPNGGYDRFINYQYNDARINEWKPHTELLTDNNTSTGFRVKSDNASANVAIVYEFSKVVDLSGFKISFGDSSLKKLKVYAAEDSSSLYNAANLISDVNASEGAILNNTITNKKAKFISFVLTTPDYTITEIDVYGEEEEEENLGVPSGDSILSSLIPVSYMAVDPGKTAYNFHEVRYQQSNGTIKWVFGYDVISGKGLTDETLPDNTTGTRKQFWNQFVTTLTDNDYTTNMVVKPMSYNDGDATKRDDVAVIYELSELVNLESIKINTNSTKSKNVKVYAATKITSLFGKKVADITTSDKIITANLAEPVGAGYIAFVFTGPDMYVREIEAFGSDYVAPNYGTNLVAGKDPMSIFLSDREYPLAPNGARLWATDAAAGRHNDMTLIPETMGWFTDNDFSKYIAWIHDGAQKFTNTDSYYKVIAYDIGSVSTLNKILIDSRCGGYDIYASEKFNDLYKTESRVYTSGGDQLLPDGTLDPSTDLEEGENLIDVAGKKARYVALVITRSRKIGVEAWDGIQLREIQVYGTPGNSDFGDNLIKGKTPIFNYRAEYSDYSLPVEWVTTREGKGLASYTDGVLATETYIQLPISGDLLTYKYGGCVFVYYLEGTCDINAFSMHAGYYSGPGGVDVYVSESYDTLFNKENQMFTTYGEAATDSIYDKSKNLGSLSLSASFDAPKRGRYVAFVITRTYDTDAIGLSGILRLGELELYGDFVSPEQLPSTTVTDSTTGSTATFNYQNPDDSFVFANKGITSFRLTKVSESEYKNKVFTNSLLQNRFKPLGDAFKVEFLDKQGKVIDNDKLSGENISFNFVHNSDGFVRLGEIRNDKIYVITEAQQFDKEMLLITDDFAKYTFMFLQFESEENFNYNGIVIDTTPVSSDSNNTTAGGTTGTGDSTTGAGGSLGDSASNNNQINNNTQSDENAGNTNKKPTSNRQWVVVDVDDPLEWFWNIYDTFAANIWMLIVCIVVLAIAAGGIVTQVIIYKKRRNK